MSWKMMLHMSVHHVLWAIYFLMCKSSLKRREAKNWRGKRKKKGEGIAEFMHQEIYLGIDMVGKRIRREPEGEAEMQKQKTKVWNKLSQGGIANYITKLHGHDSSVTNLMVNTWKDGRVNIDRVSYPVDVGVIAHVTEIPDEGLKFYRDKVSVNAVKDFTKNIDEKKELVKMETYFEMEAIKKLQRYVLRAIITYISLDTRFDRVRTHLIVLLNYFRFGIKISFPFYLFSSVNKNTMGYKKKPSASPVRHEGFLLLLYEHFKAQARNKTLTQAEIIPEERERDPTSLLTQRTSCPSTLKKRVIIPLLGRTKRGRKR